MEAKRKAAWLKFAEFAAMAVMSGIMIGLAGGACLLAIKHLGDWGRLIGAILFSLAIFAIIIFNMKLYTGMVSRIPSMSPKCWWSLVACFVFNVLGVAIVAVLLYFSPLGPVISPTAENLVAAKLDGEYWYLTCLCSSALCGFLITLSVLAPTYAPKHNLGATFGVIMPIIVFAFCGFDHSVANMLYFYLGATLSWKLVGFIAISFVGNALGGIILPLAIKLRKKAEEKSQAAADEQSDNADSGDK